MPNIGFLGFGRMASAIWNGARASVSGLTSALVCESDPIKQASISHNQGLQLVDINTLFTHSSLVLLCVKPQVFRDMSDSLRSIGQALPDSTQNSTPNSTHNSTHNSTQNSTHNSTQNSTHNSTQIVSIMAGISLAQLAQVFPTAALCRVMPNTPVLLQSGMSVLSFNASASKAFQTQVQTIFSTIGRVVSLEESFMDLVTGISGSGPAYFYQIADAVGSLSEQAGLRYKTGVELTAQTLIGAGRMLLDSGKSPTELTHDVCSPGGTTEAGLQTMANTTFLSDLQAIIMAAVRRSKELNG